MTCSIELLKIVDGMEPVSGLFPRIIVLSCGRSPISLGMSPLILKTINEKELLNIYREKVSYHCQTN